jgi:hypothetical protein
MKQLDISKQYYIGSWRRTPFDPTKMPQCLAVDSKSGKLGLSNFDAPQNNLWSFRFTGETDNFVLSVDNTASGSSMFATQDMSVSSDISKAAVFEIRPYKPFRDGPGDVAFQLKLVETSALLCSSEKTGKVMLMNEIDAEGNPAVNIAWEGTMDSDESIGGDVLRIPDWLQEMLLA